MASRLCTIFIGNLPGDVREREVEDLFYKASARLLQARTLQYPSVPFLVSTLSEQLTASQLPTAAGASRHLSGPLLAAVCTCFQSLRCFCAQYGRIRHIDLKVPPRPPAFAFVEFEDPRYVGSGCRLIRIKLLLALQSYTIVSLFALYGLKLA